MLPKTITATIMLILLIICRFKIYGMYIISVNCFHVKSKRKFLFSSISENAFLFSRRALFPKSLEDCPRSFVYESLSFRGSNSKGFCPQGELSKRSPPSWRKESIILGRHPVYFKSVERGKIFVSKTVIFQMTPYCCTVAIP